jgi:hypothetical protein
MYHVFGLFLYFSVYLSQSLALSMVYDSSEGFFSQGSGDDAFCLIIHCWPIASLFLRSQSNLLIPAFWVFADRSFVVDILF